MSVATLSAKLKKILNGTLPGGVIGQPSETYALGTVLSNIITQVNTNETTAGAAVPKAAYTTSGRVLEATGAGTYAEVAGATAATASTYMKRDGSGNSAVAGLTVGTLTEADGGGISLGAGSQIIGVPFTITAAINFDTASGAIATIPDGEVWVVQRVWFRTTTDWDGNGTVAIGDGSDPDGFLALSNTALDPAYNESGAVTGWTTGTAGLKDGGGAQNCAGVYQWDGTNDERLQKLYAPSGAAETIDATVTTGTSTAGAGVCYIHAIRLA